MQHLPDPLAARLPLLDYAVKSIKRVQAEQGVKAKPRLPILLKVLKAVSRRTIRCYGQLCVPGFLRVAEFMTPSLSAYAHLGLADVALDSHVNPTVIRLSIKASKMDLFRKGVQILLGKSGADVCPGTALVQYLSRRGTKAAPLFMFEDGSLLSRTVLVQRVHSALSSAGIDASPYSGHSFRIGVATMAAKNGIGDCIIQTMGRWKSDAYVRYVRLPREQLADVSRALMVESKAAPSHDVVA